MKTRALLLVALALALAGCATTRLDVTTPEGVHVRVAFPKNLRADRLVVHVGSHSLDAVNLRTDASGVIEAQAGGVAATAGAVTTAAASALIP